MSKGILLVYCDALTAKRGTKGSLVVQNDADILAYPCFWALFLSFCVIILAHP